MRYPEFLYRWDWTLPASPAALWPLVSDTNRFNRDTGVPTVQRLAAGEAGLANARQRLRLYRFGVPVEWEEEPFEWLRPLRFGVMRRYSAGPVATMRIRVDLAPHPNGGTHLTYRVWARPRNLLGLIAIPVQIGLLSARRFEAIMRRYGQIAAGAAPSEPTSSPSVPVPLSARAGVTGSEQRRLEKGRQELVAAGTAPDLVDRLVETIAWGDELIVARLRPYALADAWGVPRRAALELCLQATRAGLLELRWDVLCPLCRGAKQSDTSLQQVGSRVHCGVCNIDVEVNFDRFVEVTFRPNPAVRPIDVGEFCVGGPQLTPHIVAQQLLPPGATRSLTMPLEEGRYRLRTLALPGGQPLMVDANGAKSAAIHIVPTGWPAEELRLAPRPALRYDNATAREQLVILERMAWSDQAATAAEVTALQLFRDLFAREALRPGQQISVGSLAVLFTDLRDSTRLYRQIGDAPAFGLVMDHFDVLREAIVAEGGAQVKTIGDAVMAVFRRPEAALRAILAAQRRLATPPHGQQPLRLKAGIHYGPCIAVTLNERLDYFGSTINIAARLEGLSSGADVIISAAVRHDPGLEALLAESEARLSAEPLEATLKGLDDERFALWRVTMDSTTIASRSAGDV